MWLMLIALLLQQAQPADAPQTEGPPQQPEQKTYDQGEMRVDLVVLAEQRYRFLEEIGMRLPESLFALRFRLHGEDIVNLVRVGNVIVEEAVDSAGKNLVQEEPAEAEKNYTRRINARPEQLARQGWALPLQLSATTRSAEAIDVLKGYVQCVFANETEELLVLDPLQFSGKQIESAKLDELGIELTLAPPGVPAAVRNNDRVLVFKPGPGAEKIKEIKFFDAFLRPIPTRPPRDQRDDDGELMIMYQSVQGNFTEDMQMVIEVYPEVRTEQIPIHLEDVKLP